MSSLRLILASGSPYRRAQLARLGVPFQAVAHTCDEVTMASEYDGPDARAVGLARAKALSLVESHPADFILGADQVVDLGGEVLGKPGDRSGAIRQLSALQGRRHRILTAVALRRPDGGVESALVIHRMAMRRMKAAQIERYVDAERPFDCAGSYRIEARGIALFEAVEGSDFTAIEGLPLMTVVSMLGAAGFTLL